jgi:DNA-binding transcriptional LysR family regulator
VDGSISFTAALRDLNKLNTFVRVAQRRSFTKAAVELRTRPSVISKRMKELEESLGFSLVNRSTHGLILTDAGEVLFQHCLQFLKEVDHYVVERRNIDAGPFGTLRVQAGSDYARYVLVPLVMKFANHQPAVRVHLSVLPDDGSSADEGTDIIVSSQKPVSPGLLGHDLGPIEYVVCASPAYLRTSGRPKSPKDLRDHNCLTDLYSGLKAWPFQDSSGRRTQVEVKGSLSSNSAAVLIELAAKGCGVVRVPRYAVKSELAARKLIPILNDATLSPERMAAYYTKAKHVPAKTAEFLSYLGRALKGGG